MVLLLDYYTSQTNSCGKPIFRGMITLPPIGNKIVDKLIIHQYYFNLISFFPIKLTYFPPSPQNSVVLWTLSYIEATSNVDDLCMVKTCGVILNKCVN